jgi:hypothetical protein
MTGTVDTPLRVEFARVIGLAEWGAPLAPAGRIGQTLTLRPPSD